MAMSGTQRPWTVPAGAAPRSLGKDGGMGMGLVGGQPSQLGSTNSLAGVSSMGANGFGGPGGMAELDELHRKYRIAELTRKQNNEESANTLRMQRQQIEKLKKDNDRLKEDLALETRQARQANNMSATAQISKLQDQGDIYTRKIETEKRRLEELDKTIKKLQNAILIQRKEMGGVNATREQSNGVQKQIRILENRLDKALVKFNEALAHNKSLRDQIDNLRRERVVFDGIYNKLHRELQAKKVDMNEIMAEANRAYESRAAAQAEMVALKAAADREQEHLEEEWRNLGVLIDRDRRAKELSSKAKERDRMMGAVAASPSAGAGATTGGTAAAGAGRVGLGGGDPAVETEQSLRKRVTKGAWVIATDKASIHLSMEKVQSYEEAFAKIQKATRITDIDALVHTFVHAEDQNFSLFNYVNDLANEIEKVEEQQTHVRAQLAKLRGEASANGGGNGNAAAALASASSSSALVGVSGSDSIVNDTDTERKKLLAELDAKLHKNNARARASEEQFARGSQTLQSLKAGVGAIFSRLGCATAAASELLGNAGVTESNIMQYLGIIEARTNELLAAYQRHKAELGDATPPPPAGGSSGAEYGQHTNNGMGRTQRANEYGSTPLRGSIGGGAGGGPQHTDASGALSIHAPSAGAFDDEDNAGDEDADGELAEDGQPLSHEQLQNSIRRQRGEEY